MADFSEIVINTTAEKIERMANMEINNEAIDDTSDDNSLPTSKLVYDFVSNSASGGSGDCVSYSKAQNLTETQKGIARGNIDAVSVTELTGAITAANAKDVSVLPKTFTDDEKVQARNNIGAVSQAELADGLDGKVDTSLVVSNIISDTGSFLSDNIPNGSAVADFIRNNSVSSAQTQSLTLSKKARARNNIDVDGGKWELLYTIEGDGKTNKWEYTQFADGSPLKLTAVSAVVIQDVAEAENSYGFLNAYSGEKMTQVSGVIYSYFTKNSAPTTSGTQRAYAVIEQHRGQYRAYSSGMVAKNAEVLRYASYMQAKYTTADYPYIDRIKVQKQTGVFSTGNKIEVYGVRYYE